MCVRVRRHKMSKWNTERSINIEVDVELGKSTDETFVMLSEACGTGCEEMECLSLAQTDRNASREPPMVLDEAVVRKHAKAMDVS